MSPAARRARIAEELERHGSVSVSRLVELHGVSEMTIRRDLADLEERGLLRRFHGGAVLERGRSYEPPYLVRQNRQREEKQRIGAATAALIGQGESVAIDYGTTALEVARQLADRPNLSVITPNLRAGLELSEARGVRVIISGGVIRPDELSLIGREAERSFERYFVDTAVVGAGGIDVERGVTDFNAEEVAVKQAMVRGARRVIVVADETKLGVVAFAGVAAIGQIGMLVTTAPPEHEALRGIAAAGVEIHAV